MYDEGGVGKSVGSNHITKPMGPNGAPVGEGGGAPPPRPVIIIAIFGPNMA